MELKGNKYNWQKTLTSTDCIPGITLDFTMDTYSAHVHIDKFVAYIISNKSIK